jgi:hypothetical protein
MAMVCYIKITQKLSASIIQYFKIQRMKTMLQKQNVVRSTGKRVKLKFYLSTPWKHARWNRGIAPLILNLSIS